MFFSDFSNGITLDRHNKPSIGWSEAWAAKLTYISFSDGHLWPMSIGSAAIMNGGAGDSGAYTLKSGKVNTSIVPKFIDKSGFRFKNPAYGRH